MQMIVRQKSLRRKEILPCTVNQSANLTFIAIKTARKARAYHDEACEESHEKPKSAPESSLDFKLVMIGHTVFGSRPTWRRDGFDAVKNILRILRDDLGASEPEMAAAKRQHKKVVFTPRSSMPSVFLLVNHLAGAWLRPAALRGSVLPRRPGLRDPTEGPAPRPPRSRQSDSVAQCHSGGPGDVTRRDSTRTTITRRDLA